MNKEIKNNPLENKIDIDSQMNIADNEELIPEENLDQMMKELKEDTKEQMQLLQEEKNPVEDTDKNNITLKNEEIKKFKLFFVSDMDDEAKYLHEMSVKGLHFLRKKGAYYIFEKEQARNYYYHLSYYEKDKRDSERYLSNYEEAGWTNIYHEKAEFDGIWNYFRIELEDGETDPDIFSDRVSRIALYKRLLNSWKSLLAIVLICFVFMLFISYFLYTHPSAMTLSFMVLSGIVMVVIVATFVIYLRAYLRINKKLEELLNL